jgi:hypothetical protein
VLHAVLLCVGASQELALDVLQCLVRSRVLFTRLTGAAAADSGSLDLTPESTKVCKLALSNEVPVCTVQHLLEHSTLGTFEDC